MRQPQVCLVWIVMLWLLNAGCTAGPPLPAGPAPADFSLVVCVQVIPARQANPAQAHTFVVEPDRTLRAATGPGCTLRTFPQPTATLDPAELQALYDLARQIDFSHTQTPPSSSQSRLWVRVVVKAEGRRLRADFGTPIYGDDLAVPEDSPMYPAVKLMGELFVHSYMPILKTIDAPIER